MTHSLRSFKDVSSRIASSSTSIHDLTILTYNILANKYATADVHEKADQPQNTLSWEYRAPRIIEEITRYNAQIICLQEVERPFFEDMLNPQLKQLGYESIYYGRTTRFTQQDSITGPQDGCSISFQTSKIELLSTQRTQFSEYIPKIARSLQASSKKSDHEKISKSSFLKSMRYRNDGALIALFKDKHADKLFIAVNTHLFWDPKFPAIKLMQAHILCNAIITFMVEHRLLPTATRFLDYKNEIPLIIAGDLNSIPIKSRTDVFDQVPEGSFLVSGAYELLTKGSVDALHHDHPFQRQAHNKVDRDVLQALPTNSCGIELKSACKEGWGAEPPTTNHAHNGFSGCLDYILYSPKHFEVDSLLEMPYDFEKGEMGGADSVEVEFPRIPNEDWPSDHLAVGAILKWK